jgi:hypothetical protein
LKGVWRARGYGDLLVIRDNDYSLYEETAVSCLPCFGGPLSELTKYYKDIRLSPRGMAFSAMRTAGVSRVHFRRMKTLPAACAPPDPKIARDPVLNFEMFCRHFAEHYALFDLRGVDWQGLRRTYEHEVHAGTPSRRLYDIFCSMLHPLRDGHVRLHSSCGHFNAGDIIPLQERLARELDDGRDSRDVSTYLAELREELREIIRENYMRSPPCHAAHHHLEWGRIDGNTGYLAIRAMAGLSGKGGHPVADIDAADAAMTDIMEDLWELPFLVVDLRGNGGGYDAVALRLAGYFTDRKRLAFTKSARRDAGFTGEQSVYVEPQSPLKYAGDLVLLTSGLTASAAEIFVLSLMNHPRVTRVGEPTSGILSDVMERHLPNGWMVTLSNELYRAVDGELYEDRGIPPHVDIRFLDRASRGKDEDAMLEYVIHHMPRAGLS